MSTDDSQPTGAQPTPPEPVPGSFGAPEGGAPDPADPGLPGEPAPGWFDRNAALVIAVSVAVIVAAAALVTLFFYRESVDDANADTESAVSDFVEEQGGEVESVQCDDDSCSAIVGGTAYTVLVHEDEDGKQTFGITAYVGD